MVQSPPATSEPIYSWGLGPLPPLSKLWRRIRYEDTGPKRLGTRFSWEKMRPLQFLLQHTGYSWATIMTLEPGFTLSRFLGNCGCPLDSVPSRELCLPSFFLHLKSQLWSKSTEVPQPKSSTVYHLISEQEKKMDADRQAESDQRPASVFINQSSNLRPLYSFGIYFPALWSSGQ